MDDLAWGEGTGSLHHTSDHVASRLDSQFLSGLITQQLCQVNQFFIVCEIEEILGLCLCKTILLQHLLSRLLESFPSIPCDDILVYSLSSLNLVYPFNGVLYSIPSRCLCVWGVCEESVVEN